MDLNLLREQTPSPFHEEDREDDQLIVVHLSKGEIPPLDSAQGGESIDPETGLREYSQLWERMRTVPEMKEIFEGVSSDLSDNGRIDNPLLREVYKIGKKSLPKYVKAPADFNPMIEREENLGRDGDSELALFPVGLADFFDKLRGGKTINPKTGLREYFFKGVMRTVSNFIRPAATIAGAVMGGPLGAVAGNALGRIATGQKMGSALMSSLPNALYAGMGQLGAQALTNFAPGLASGITGASQAGLGSTATGWLGNALNNGQGLSLFGPSVGQVAASAAAPGATAAGSTAAAVTPAAPGYMDLLKNVYNAPGMNSVGNVLSHPTSLMLGAAALKYKGDQDEKKEMAKEKKRIEQQNRENAQAFGNWDPDPNMSEHADAIRFVPRLVKQFDAEGHEHTNVERVQLGPDGEPIDGHGRHARRRNSLAPNYAHGGSVTGEYHTVRPSANSSEAGYIAGAGKGQEDLVPKDVPANSYILDATTISSLGDGSSLSGKSEVDKTIALLRRKAHPKIVQKIATGGKVHGGKLIPAMLSDGEYEITPEDVALIGEGSNAKGAKMLKNVVKTLRKHKNSNGDRLPPKSKDLLYYIREAARA